MEKSVVLIDFENIFYKKEITKELLCMNLSSMIDNLMLKCEIETIDIRLYDGWRKQARSTQKADVVSSVIEQVEAELFPIVNNKSKIYGKINLAISQYGIDYEWENTLSIKSGVHRLSINNKEMPDYQCCNDINCPLQIISKASKGENVNCPIDVCESVNFNKLVRNEQKMVDAMMGSDLLEFAIDEDYDIVVIASDDMDILPSLLLASRHKAAPTLLLYVTRNKWHLKQYSSLFSKNDIISILWE